MGVPEHDHVISEQCNPSKNVRRRIRVHVRILLPGRAVADKDAPPRNSNLARLWELGE